MHCLDMLKSVRIAASACCEACCISGRGCGQTRTFRRTTGFQACLHKRLHRSSLKPKTVQPHRFSGAVVASSSVTTQSVTEAVRQASVDRPLLHHALHSVGSSLAWFGLVWVITRYIGRKSKEFEAPEVHDTQGPLTAEPTLHTESGLLQEAAPSFLSDASDSTPRIKRPFHVHAGQALLVGANLPIAVFAPMAAVVYSLRSVAWFLSVALASQANQQSFSTPLGGQSAL